MNCLSIEVAYAAIEFIVWTEVQRTKESVWPLVSVVFIMDLLCRQLKAPSSFRFWNLDRAQARPAYPQILL